LFFGGFDLEYGLMVSCDLLFCLIRFFKKNLKKTHQEGDEQKAIKKML
jgi:hypothetical protein